MSKTVLIVDDDPTQRRLMQAVLEREGFAVAQADSGEAALDRVASGLLPDVVILDLVMPRMSGIEATRAISESVPTAKVLMLTVSDEEEDLYEAVKAQGLEGVLAKRGGSMYAQGRRSRDWLKIKDPKLRKRVLDLVKQMSADESEGAA